MATLVFVKKIFVFDGDIVHVRCDENMEMMFSLHGRYGYSFDELNELDIQIDIEIKDFNIKYQINNGFISIDKANKELANEIKSALEDFIIDENPFNVEKNIEIDTQTIREWCLDNYKEKIESISLN